MSHRYRQIIRSLHQTPNSKLQTSFGFTLIELLVVIIIIGTLTGVSIYGLSTIKAKSRDAKRKADMEKFKTGINNFFVQYKVYPNPGMNNPNYPASSLTAVLPMPDDPEFKCSLDNDKKIIGYSSVNNCLAYLGFMDEVGQNSIGGDSKNYHYAVNLDSSTGDMNWEISAQMEKTDTSSDCTAGSPNCDDDRYEIGSAVDKINSSGSDYVYYTSASAQSYKKAITIDHTKVAANLTNYPMLFSTTKDELKSVSYGGHVANDNGNDIYFTDASENLLKFEIEKYDPAVGQLVAWIKIFSLSSTNDTTIQLYYGNESITSSKADATAVWDANYKGVWHLKESGGPYSDSTSNNNDNSTGMYPTQTDGKIDKAQSFNGSNQFIKFDSSPSLSYGTTFTISTWFKTSTVAWRWLVTKTGASWLGISSDAGKFTWTKSAGNDYKSTYLAANNQWHFGTAVFDNGNLNLYVDGNNVGSWSGVTLDATGNEIFIGQRGDNCEYFNGFIDEARVSSTARSNGWISTEFNNEFDPSTFSTEGSEQTPDLTLIFSTMD